MQQISSKQRVEEKKSLFYKTIMPKIKQKSLEIKKSVSDKTSSLLITADVSGLKIGPVFGNFDPKNSYGLGYNKIVEDLALSINPYKITIDKPKQFIINKLQDVALSQTNLELDISLENKLNFNFEPDSILNPIGLKAKIKDLTVVDNPKVPWQVDQVLEEKAKATEMLSTLQGYGFDNYYLTKIFSAGTLGIDKRLVSTRQSITAVDDILAKEYLKDIRTYDKIDSFIVFNNEFLHNRFVIVLMPGNWEYEQFECWPKGSEWSTEFGYNREYEGFSGRTKYAEAQAGGYYAARLSVVEFLKDIKMQARVLVIREIYSDYAIPVGVWQVRENVKHALQKPPTRFNSKEEVLEYMKKNLRGLPNAFLKDSILFKQNRLSEFF